ncbi:MAG: SpoIIIAH-like family protein [Defluviitaleaceae bacterium]|nr:SpoIIIAH-like family protein [Defluviitaleaceae bacterium]
MKKFMFKRNQVIITALVAMIGVAGYLNWHDSRAEVEFAQAIALDDFGQVTQRPGDLDLDYIYYEYFDDMFLHDMPWISSQFDFDYDFADSHDVFYNDFAHEHMHEPGEAVFVSATDSPPFFMQARLEREQSRARQTDILMNMVNEQNIDMDQRAIITDAMLEIQSRIERETATEAMLESRGFSEAYVRIADQYVDIVVAREALSDSELAQIEDAVRRNTGMSVNQIRVTPKRQ